MFKKILFIYILLSIINSNCAIFVIHGTTIVPQKYEKKTKWFKPQGDFFQTLEEEAKKINQPVISFDWSGSINTKGRMIAAEELSREILKHIKEVNILICHSHGGTIALLASYLLNALKELPLFSSLEDITYFNRSYKNLENERKILQSVNKYPIDFVYLLGTPLHCKKLKPNMKVIKQLINFYSIGDGVQTILGRYQRIVTPMPRSTNLQVVINGKNPSHRDMHDPIIAKSILTIPNCFEDFTWDNDGKINFYSDKCPEYKI